MTTRLLLALTLSLAACGGDSKPDSPATPPTASNKVMRDKDFDGAVPILEALEKTAGDEVVVEGRVSSIVKGFVAFTLTDQSLPYCGQEEACGCTTPWDYCCDIDKAKVSRIPVEMRDAKDNPVPSKDLDLRLLDLVAVKGTFEATESGGLLLVIRDGLYRRERPEVAENVVFPE